MVTGAVAFYTVQLDDRLELVADLVDGLNASLTGPLRSYQGQFATEPDRWSRWRAYRRPSFLEDIGTARYRSVMVGTRPGDPDGERMLGVNIYRAERHACIGPADRAKYTDEVVLSGEQLHGMVSAFTSLVERLPATYAYALASPDNRRAHAELSTFPFVTLDDIRSLGEAGVSPEVTELEHYQGAAARTGEYIHKLYWVNWFSAAHVRRLGEGLRVLERECHLVQALPHGGLFVQCTETPYEFGRLRSLLSRLNGDLAYMRIPDSPAAGDRYLD